MRLTKKQLARLVREEMLRRRGRPLREAASASGIDWESEKGRAIGEAAQSLAFAVIEYFVDEDGADRFDSYVPEVNNDIVACVEKVAAEYDWEGDAEDDGSWEAAGRMNGLGSSSGPIVSR